GQGDGSAESRHGELICPGLAGHQIFAGWRGLGRFWLLVAALLIAIGVGLQLAGPPRPMGENPVASRPPQPQPPAEEPAKPASGAVATAPTVPHPGRDTPGPIADPDPALQGPMSGSTAALIPRIAADGRMPMQVYAAGFDSSSRRPRVGL